MRDIITESHLGILSLVARIYTCSTNYYSRKLHWTETIQAILLH